MAVILSLDDYGVWLDPGTTDPARVADLVRPFDTRLTRVYSVALRIETDLCGVV
jgi:putative SOS response-associated peptidase YedK